ncbi:hypothetical protein AMTRI_Chr08g164230 [Amborella trichopoda]
MQFLNPWLYFYDSQYEIELRHQFCQFVNSVPFLFRTLFRVPPLPFQRESPSSSFLLNNVSGSTLKEEEVGISLMKVTLKKHQVAVFKSIIEEMSDSAGTLSSIRPR